ncbi:MAG: oligosaccharide flippase family protein [Oleiphilaceae bacterium]|nr:oligosaccharide flippase family protein [Oleiphilaceae bacterium]
MLRKLAVNTGSNLAQLLVGMVVTFVMAPIYLQMMGHHDYGLREMVMALVGYMGMLDLGMRPTVSRFAALYNASRDRRQLLVVYASSLVFMVLVGVVLAVFFWVWALSFPQILVPEEGNDSARYALFLLIVGAQLLFAFPKFVAESYLEGLQRYYLKNLINIASTIAIAVISYICITPENGLILLVSLVAISVVVKLVIFTVILWRPALGVIYPSLRYFSPAQLREMLAFGLKSFIQGASQKVETASDRLVIGTLLGPASVPVYTISSTLVSYVGNLTMTLTHVFMPLFSDLNARGETDRIREIYQVASKFVVGLVVPMSVGIAVVGAPFIHIWMNGVFDPVTVNSILVLLVIYIAVPKLNPFASRYLTAINRHGIFARVAPPAALLNLALSVWLVTEVGVIGAALGSVFPVFIVTPVFLRASCRSLGIPVSRYLRRCLLPSLLPVIPMAALVLWMRHQGLMDTYGGIIMAVVAAGVVYLVLFWGLSLDAAEKRFFMDRLRKTGR